MAILFAGSERGDFEELGTITSTTSATFIDTNAVRSGIGCNNNLGGFARAQWATVSEAWCSFTMAYAAGGSSNMYFVRLGGKNASGALVYFMRVWMSNITNQYEFQHFNGSAWVSLYSWPPPASNIQNRLTLAAKIHATTGYFRAYVNGVQVGEYVGNTTAYTDAVEVTSLEFSPHNSSTTAIYFSEIIVADEDTTAMRLSTLAPTADGANTAWTGDYTAVDEVGRDASDFISSTAADQVETYVMSDINATVLGSRVVKAVVVTASMRRGTTGPQNAAAAVRIGGVDYESGLFNPTTNPVPRQVIIHNSPATGAAWTSAEVNGAEIGLKSKA